MRRSPIAALVLLAAAPAVLAQAGTGEAVRVRERTRQEYEEMLVKARTERAARYFLARIPEAPADVEATTLRAERHRYERMLMDSLTESAAAYFAARAEALLGAGEPGPEPVDRGDPAAVAAAILRALGAKDLHTLAELATGENAEAIREIAEKGEAHPRWTSLWRGPQWEAMRDWDGRIREVRRRGDRARAHFAELSESEILVVTLTLEQGRWCFSDVHSPSRASFEEWGDAPEAEGVEKARVERAKADLRTIEMALQLYRIDRGKAPDTLEELAEEGGGGPYLERIPTDPWGEPYVYRQHGRSVVLSSKGPDRHEDTEDDIRP